MIQGHWQPAERAALAMGFRFSLVKINPAGDSSAYSLAPPPWDAFGRQSRYCEGQAIIHYSMVRKCVRLLRSDR